MKQYCRYCYYATQVEDEMCACNKLNIAMGKAKATRTNKCKYFALNELDVFNIEHKYKPRKKKENIKQRTLFDEVE